MSFLPPPPEHHDGGEGGSWRRRDRGRRGRELQHDKNWRDIRALGASAEQEEKVKSLMIQGYAADLVADDETALALHQENHMIRWRGQEDDPIIIDRFDGRALLDDRSKFAKMKGRRRVDDYDDQEQAAEEAKLDKERYSDLVGEQGSEEDEGSAADGKGGKGKFGALGFQYGGAAGGAKGTGEDAPFTPSFEVPEDMVLPSTIRVHRIIGQTARRIREKPQLEFLLKIKQADNATFSFLQDSDPLHPYYLMLKEEEKEPDVDYTAPLPDEDAKQKAQEEAERQAKVEAALKKRAVKSLLGNAYYSDDEEADDEVLEPGPEMKAVMEKLATFVKRNGKAFEDKVAEREVNNPRFAFLKPEDIFHKYYRQLVGPSKTDDKPEASEKQTSVKTEDKQEQQQGQVEEGQEGKGDKAAAEATDALKHAATTSLLLPPTGRADHTEPPSDAAAADPSVAAAARAPGDVGAVSAPSDAAAKDSEGVEGSGNTSAVEEKGSESEGGGGDTAGAGTEGEEGQTEEMRRRAERLKRARMMQGHFKIALLSPPAPAAPSPVTAEATDPSLGGGKSDDVSRAVAKYIESEAKQNGAGEQGGGDRKEEEEPREPYEDKKKSKKKHKKKDKRRDRSPSAHDDDRARKKRKAEARSHSRGGDRSRDRSLRRKGDEGRSRERETHKRRDRSRSRSRSHSERRTNKRDRSDSRLDRHRSRSRGRKKRR